MKSRFWNTWTKEEPKVRSPIIIKDRDQRDSLRDSGQSNDNRNKIHQYSLSSRVDRFQLITDNNNDKLRNGYKEVCAKNKDDSLHKQQQHLSRHRDNVNSKNIWEPHRNRYYDQEKILHYQQYQQHGIRNQQQPINYRRRKSKGSTSIVGNNSDNNKSGEPKLTNGKLEPSNNGFTKQVKRSDESLDRERRGAKYQQTYHQEDMRNFFYDVETPSNGITEPIKFVRKFEEYECRYDKPRIGGEEEEEEDEEEEDGEEDEDVDVDQDEEEDDDDDEDGEECYKQTRYSSSSSSSRKINGDFIHGRSLSPLDDSVSKGCKREFIYLDKRSWRHCEEQSPDRAIELIKAVGENLNSNSNCPGFVNGSRRNGNCCDSYVPGKKTASDKTKINRKDFDLSVGKFDKIREHKKGFNLVRSARGSSSEHEERRRNYSGHRSLEDKNYFKMNINRDSSSGNNKRESSRDRQIFRKISLKLKGKDKEEKEKDIKNNSSESESIKSKPRRDNRHSRPLSPPTFENIEADEVVPRQHRKVFSSSKDFHHQNHQNYQNHQQQQLRLRDDYGGKREEVKKMNNHNYQHHHHCDSRDLSWIERELSSWYSSEESPEREKTKNKSSKPPRTRCLLSDEDDDNDEDRDGDEDEDDDDEDDESDLGFSTRIERNGATVIRIHTNSKTPERRKSPERITDRRYLGRRTRNISPDRYTFRDDDELVREDDDDYDHLDAGIDFFGLRKLSTDSLTRNFHDSNVQITDLEDGQPCLQCGETCSGFSPHTWRKNCTSCKCPKEVHDVCHEEWVSVRARLGLKSESSNNYIGFEPRDRGLAWAPPGLPPHKVEEYFSMLPEISVPRLGTPGERHRDRQLATQLPKQDLARTYCRHLDPRHAASADDFMAARNEIALDIGSVQEVLERGHECGVCHEPFKYGSLAVMASKLGLLYHPACFQCAQCHELLVDLAYCVHDDALYCERHYAERLKPRCAACDELIFSGEYTKAMNKDWHSGHFCCWQCDESLTGQRYVLRDEHPYCIKCYESVFANGCEECNKIIGIDSKDLSYKDKHWHEACFLCNKCRVSLVDKQFGSKVDKIYCGNCYDAQFASRCDGCGEIFRAGTKKMEYKTRQWHEKCFCCVVCKNPIGTKSFIPREQEIYCAGCYEDKFATRCVKCNKIITSGGVTYKNEPWHRDCFTCSHCNNSLAGQRFTSRDDKPYCAECFGELFAKRCTACTKPITGIGGTRFISFEDRHWHNDCFICAGCKTSLVGRGFITDGDDIICPECAKQKLSE